MTAPSPAIHNDIVYTVTPQRPLRLDLRVPDSASPPPLVMYIPMGGMRVCDKSVMPTWLLDHGFAVASIEARVSSEVTAPHQIYDCKAAIRFLRANATRFGFDGGRIGAFGHSAGGLLASILATSGNVPQLEGDGGNEGVSSAIQASCDECGVPHDITYFGRPDVMKKYAPVTENVRLYLGGSVAEKTALAQLVSATTYISRQRACPPLLLIHGDADEIVPVEEMITYHKQLTDAGIDATLRILPGMGHGWPLELTQQDIVAFFKRTLQRS